MSLEKQLEFEFMKDCNTAYLKRNIRNTIYEFGIPFLVTTSGGTIGSCLPDKPDLLTAYGGLAFGAIIGIVYYAFRKIN